MDVWNVLASCRMRWIISSLLFCSSWRTASRSKTIPCGNAVGQNPPRARQHGTQPLARADAVSAGVCHFSVDGDRGPQVVPTGDLANRQSVPIMQRQVIGGSTGKRCGNVHLVMRSEEHTSE